MDAKPPTPAERIWFAVSSPHPYQLAAFALGILANDAEFPKTSLHWLLDAVAILQGTALMLMQWKANPNAPPTMPGNALIPPPHP